MADVLAERDQVDAAALALEMRSARLVTRALRKAVARLVAHALAEAAKARLAHDQQLTPAQQQTARTALNTAAAALAVDVAAQTTAAVTAALALALRQETPLLRELGIDPKTIATRITDPVLSQAGQSSQRVLAVAIGDVRQLLAGPLVAPADLEAIAARAAAVTARVERNVRFVTNRAINQTTFQIAASATTLQPPAADQIPRTPLGGQLQDTVPYGEQQPPMSANNRSPLVENGLRVVWVNERDACLVCLALAGHVIDPNSGDGFDEFATFSPHPAPAVWPPGMPLMGPPRHPNCRCRLRIIAADNTMVPEALRREAERSVARGWSAHDSRRSRLRAADMLVRRANRLPRTVNERAAKNVAAGSFSTRHRPRAPHLRAD